MRLGRQADAHFREFGRHKQRDKVPPRHGARGRDPVTVCVAALCSFNYAAKGEPDDWALVAITASDRMITFGDVQYEPAQMKLAQMTKQTLLLLAGDYSLHSEA